MSETKPLKNGHDKPKTPSQSAAALRMRRVRDRKRRGALAIRDIEVGAPAIDILSKVSRLPQHFDAFSWSEPSHKGGCNAIADKLPVVSESPLLPLSVLDFLSLGN